EKIALAAALSHPVKKPAVPLQYVGALSRFAWKEGREEKHLLIILSGPEPQRTLLEKIVVNDLKNYTAPVVLVRGLPQTTENIAVAANVIVYNHLPSIDLEEKMLEASFVISRCGYSTVMDLAVLKKKSILIPTPGQTEQQYLASHLMKRNFALCVAQKRFRLKNALELAQSFPYHVEAPQKHNLDTAINLLIKDIATRSSAP
ncbi:MAG TPA: glycosyltransferase, partial [Flavisolibacter sp.]|nr:glycosyltransferase [Flavisolibacter sp.]